MTIITDQGFFRGLWLKHYRPISDSFRLFLVVEIIERGTVSLMPHRIATSTLGTAVLAEQDLWTSGAFAPTSGFSMNVRP